MSVRIVQARLSALSAEVAFHHADLAAHTFAGIWATSAARTFSPELARVQVRVHRDGGLFVIEGHADEPAQVSAESLVCPTIERGLYDRFLLVEQRAGRAIVHASGLTDGDTTYVFAGVSGSGKSALARAALARGLGYFGDEHLVTDGQRIWGVPRAIHLDLEPYDRPAPPWHEGADRDSYVFTGHGGQRLRLPFVPVREEQLAAGCQPLPRVVLVALEHAAEDAVVPLGAAARVALVEGANFVRSPGLARLALVPRAFSLRWREPEHALALLRAQVAAGR